MVEIMGMPSPPPIRELTLNREGHKSIKLNLEQVMLTRVARMFAICDYESNIRRKVKRFIRALLPPISLSHILFKLNCRRRGGGEYFSWLSRQELTAGRKELKHVGIY